MDNILLKLKELRANVIVGGLLYILLGFLFVFRTRAVVGTLSTFVGTILVFIGVVQLLGKIFDEENRASGILVGALLGVIGVWIILNPQFTASILPIVVGVMLVVAAFQKATMAFTARKVEMPRWWIFIVLAIVDFLIGIVCIVRAFQVVTFGMVIVGLMMIYVGVTSIVAAIHVSRHQRVVEGMILKEEDI